MKHLRLPLYVALFFVASSALPTTEPVAQLLEAFLNSGGKSSPLKVGSGLLDSLKELDFYSTGRIALPLPLSVSVVLDLGGAGAGSPFLPLPSPQRIYFDWTDTGSLSPAAAQAKTMFLKMIQDRFAELFSSDDFDVEDGEKSIDFFNESPSADRKKHLLERLFSFRMTPGLVYALKLFLLLKHAGEHYRKSWRDGKNSSNRFIQGFSYVADVGILTLRLFAAWRRDSRAIGGISAAIEENMPSLGELLRNVSRKCIPQSMNPSRDELYLHRKLDSMWKLIVQGDGIVFGPDGSVQRGLGCSVTGLECRSAEEAALLGEFLSQKQINWDKLETQDMPNKPFIVRAAMLAQMYAMQLGRLPEKARDERLAKFEPVRDAIEDIVMRQGLHDFGRFDFEAQDAVGIHAQLKTKEFRELIGPDRPLGEYNALPKVVYAGNYVYYCTNETGATDAAKIVAVIFFQALWRYIEVVRGNNEMNAELTAKIMEKERRQKFAQAYLDSPEASFLKLPLGLLMERPTTDFYAIAGQYFKDSAECSKVIKSLISDTVTIHVKAAQRVGNLYREALLNLANKPKFASHKEKIGADCPLLGVVPPVKAK